jgi:hypothetical protein
MAQDTLRGANQFDISGPIAISYATTSITGKPQLSCRDAERDRRFTGDEITRVDDANLGALVSVVLHAEPDDFVRSFTLVVPAVRGELGSATEFSTFGFVTVARESIAGPPAGVQHTSPITRGPAGAPAPAGPFAVPSTDVHPRGTGGPHGPNSVIDQVRERAEAGSTDRGTARGPDRQPMISA